MLSLAHLGEEDLSRQVDLLQGTLDLLILKAVSLGSLHGYGVLLRIGQLSGDQLLIQQGSLYPALHRLEAAGALKTEWAPSENNRRAKFYSLTRKGKLQLKEETAKWSQMARLLGAILRVTALSAGPLKDSDRMEHVLGGGLA